VPSIRPLCLIFVLCILAPAYLHAGAGTDDEPLVEERRLRLWSAQTGNRDLVYSTFLRVDHLRGTDPGSWVYEWSQIGKYFHDRGEALAAAGERGQARAAFLNAAKFYGIARFPAKTLPGQEEAYRLHLQSYQRAGEFFDPPLVVVDMPYDGRNIQGYLHLPPDADRPPLILWNGGIDTWKGDLYNNIRPYIDRGFAVMTFDVLGTGENTAWPAKPDSNKLHSAVLAFMRDHPLIDGAHIAHVGFSFSGYYAARNSITEPGFFAVIAACAPVDEGWMNTGGGPWEIREAMAAAVHMPVKDYDAVARNMQEFSLVRQGLLNGPDSVKVPLLVIDGDLDNLVPVSDLRLLADSGRQTDLWIMGGDEHCFGQYRSIAMPKMADWLWKKLEASKAAD